MLASRIVNIVSGLLVSIVVTRYLGPEQKGFIANVTAIASFFGFLSSFGLGDILIKEYSAYINESKETAISAAILMLIGGIFSFSMAGILAVVAKVDEITLRCVFVCAMPYLFGFLSVFEYWFYSQSQSKIYTIGQFLIHVLCLVLRVIGVILEASVTWFVLCIAVEQLLTRFTLVFCYRFSRVKMQGRWKATVNKIRSLLKLCIPLLTTGFATSIYMKVDQIMVGYMLSDSELGIYSVAVTLAEYRYFVPGVIYMSFLPILTEERKNRIEFKNVLTKLGDILILISYSAIVGVILLGQKVVEMMYGIEFRESANILNIYIWSGVFTSLSYIGQAYFIIYNNTKILMKIQVIGAILNFVFNFILIPIWGIYGAAFATVFEYMIVAFGQIAILGKKYPDLYGVERICFFPFKRIAKMLAELIMCRKKHDGNNKI